MGCASSSPTLDDKFDSIDKPVEDTFDERSSPNGDQSSRQLQKIDTKGSSSSDFFNSFGRQASYTLKGRSAECGVSWTWLKDFVKKNRGKLVGLTTAEVVKQFVIPSTTKRKCRYVDIMVVNKVGPPSHYVVHSWDALFLDTFELCKQFIRGGAPTRLDSNLSNNGSMAAPMSPVGPTSSDQSNASELFLWLDVFALNQHESEVDVIDLNAMTDAITHSTATLLCLDPKGKALNTALVQYAMWKTHSLEAGLLKVLCKMSDLDFGGLVRTYWNINVEDATASNEREKQAVMDSIMKVVGRKSKFNDLVKRALVTAISREATLLENYPDNQATAEGCWKCAVFFHLEAEYKSAGPLYCRALTICKEVLGEETIHTAVMRHSYAELLKAQGRHEEAEKSYVAALRVSEKVYGSKHPHTATCLHDYGKLLISMGRKNEAKMALSNAYETRKQLFGIQDYQTQASFHLLESV